jgi:hypothetical protein
MVVNPKLLSFIKEARKRGFDDYKIKEAIIKKGWPQEMVEEAFACLRQKERDKLSESKDKHRIIIYLEHDVKTTIEKRAKKNLFTLEEQIEDILRRSCVNTKKNASSSESDKLDDKFIGLFSRRNSGRPKK